MCNLCANMCFLVFAGICVILYTTSPSIMGRGEQHSFMCLPVAVWQAQNNWCLSFRPLFRSCYASLTHKGFDLQ